MLALYGSVCMGLTVQTVWPVSENKSFDINSVCGKAGDGEW